MIIGSVLFCQRERARAQERERGVCKSCRSDLYASDRTVMYSRLNAKEWLSNRLTPSAPAASPCNESPGARVPRPGGRSRRKISKGTRWWSADSRLDRGPPAFPPKGENAAEAPFPSTAPRAKIKNAAAEIGHLPPSSARPAARGLTRAKLTRSCGARPRRPNLEKDR